jgi:OOP family OmpA-OmpF porin
MNGTLCRATAALAGALAMLFAGAAAAQRSEGAAEPGPAQNFYAGLALGQAKAAKACDGIAECDDTDHSFGVFAGYWFHPRFALETGYHNLGNASAPGGTFVRSNVWELVGVGAWPLGNGPFSLYAKLGLDRGAQEGGGARMAEKQRTMTVTYGVGGQVDVGRRFGLRAEWQRYPRLGGGPVLPAGDIDVLRLAALWRFR